MDQVEIFKNTNLSLLQGDVNTYLSILYSRSYSVICIKYSFIAGMGSCFIHYKTEANVSKEN